ncbi:MAG: porin family protein [Mariprofundus sp.]|nr:porin family protein [Mariprofundus sp.]
MNRTIKMALATCMMFAFAGAAQASDPYVGAGFGAFNLGTGVTKKAVGGGYLQIGDDFSDYLGAELRIGASGKTGEELTLQPRTGIDYFAAAFLKPQYHFDDNWMAYGLIGVATLKASYSKGAFPKQKKTRTGYAYGAGLQYRFAENYAIGLEYSHMLSKPKTTAAAINTNFKGLESSMFTLSAKYYLF